MRHLIVYAGANGAGKSTLRADGGDPVDLEIDPDRIAREINPTDPRAVDFAAGKEALRRFDQALAAGLSLSLETTLTGRTVLARMQAAREAGYDVMLRYVAVATSDVNIERVTARVAAGGHWIEPEAVRRRVAGNLENLPVATAIAHRAVLLDNSGPAHRRVLEVEQGRVALPGAGPAGVAGRAVAPRVAQRRAGRGRVGACGASEPAHPARALLTRCTTPAGATGTERAGQAGARQIRAPHTVSHSPGLRHMRYAAPDHGERPTRAPHTRTQGPAVP